MGIHYFTPFYEIKPTIKIYFNGELLYLNTLIEIISSSNWIHILPYNIQLLNIPHRAAKNLKDYRDHDFPNTEFSYFLTIDTRQ